MQKILPTLCLTIGLFFAMSQNVYATWEVQSVDTMKYSRDVSREKLKDASFDIVIEQQIRNISQTGATHVAIGTPYDAEFLPIMKRWVTAARKHNLNVWYRGNFSGWEKWFGYQSMTRDEHKDLTKQFILSNKDLFRDGDIFTPCPECENGGPGDPRMNGDAEGHKAFLIEEYGITRSAFEEIGVNVRSNYNSMNGDVAKLIMDRETTAALGGVVVVDHYVGSTDRLAREIREYAENSGGRVVLGEFGAPIPDLHGDQNEEEQAAWIDDALQKLSQIEELEGINYWTSTGGSTELWSSKGKARKGVSVLSRYYAPKTLTVSVRNALGEALYATAMVENRTFTSRDGIIVVKHSGKEEDIQIQSAGYDTYEINGKTSMKRMNIQLVKTNEDFQFQIRKLLKFVLQLPRL